MAEDRIRVVARIVSKPNRIEETLELLRSLVAPTRSEAGCIRYELMQSRATPAEFMFVEEWANEAALNAHFLSDHVKGAFVKVPELLAEQPDIRQYRLLV